MKTILLILACLSTSVLAQTQAYYRHHQRTTTTALEADLVAREVGIDASGRNCLVGKTAAGTAIHVLCKESDTASLSGVFNVTGQANFSAAIKASNYNANSIPFFGTGGLVTEDGTNFTFDNTNDRLAVKKITAADSVILTAGTATTPLYLSAGKVITSGAFTGTGTTFALSASPTFTGTAGFANTTNSGTLGVTGASTLAALAATTGTFSSTLGVTGTLTGAAANFSGAVSTGALSATTGALSSTLSVLGVATIDGNVNINGGTNTANWRLNIASGHMATTGGFSLTSFGVGGPSDFAAGNTEYVQLRHDDAVGKIIVGKTGTGTYRDFLIYTNNAERLRISASTGAATFAAAPIFSSVTASQFLLVDGSKALTSVAGTGSGSVVRATGATLVTPTLGVATATSVTASSLIASSTVAAGGFELNGRFRDNVDGLTANTTLTTSYSTIFAEPISGNFTITLPPASGNSGITYTIFRTGTSANIVTVDGDGSETIGGSASILLEGNSGNARLVIVCDGGGWLIKELYDEGTFAATLTGGTTSPTTTCYFVRVGKHVTLTLGNTANVTSNANTFTYTGLPVAIQPATVSQEMTLSFALDNTAAVYNVGARVVPGSDVITFTLNSAPTGWTSSGSKGLAGSGVSKTITYTLL